VFLRPVEPDGVPQALTAALQGGDPVAPLPLQQAERRVALGVLQLDRPVIEPDAAAVFLTSGSTGQPKGVVLSRAAIAASVTATHERLGGPGDWVLALPTNYVAGLMVAARALLAGTELHTVTADLTSLPSTVSRMAGRRYISLVPTQLVRAMREARLSHALAQFDAVLVGGAAADPGLLSAARALDIAVVTTYGMSETCGGCVYDGAPLAGVRVDVELDSDRIRLCGPMLFSGYRLRPDLTHDVLRDGRLFTPDRGRWRHGRLSVLGRIDDVVISGGVNVDLAAVERRAAAWPGLSDGEVAVVGLPDADWGTRVTVVLTGGGSAEDLLRWLRQDLPTAAVPRSATKVAKLPRTTSGKIDRQRLTAELSGKT
jgi:O-succinylbenzoic acid--CoA ligase